MPGVIAQVPKLRFLNSSGSPLAGGTLTVYSAGTTTLATTYQDEALSIANTNPITLDGVGACVVWLDSTKSYKLVLADSAGAVQWTQDNIVGGGVDTSIELAAPAIQAATDQAEASATAAEASRDAIDNRIYPSASATDPTSRPDGSAVQSGDMYFNSSSSLWMRFNGATWQASDIDTANLAAPGGSALVGTVASGTGAVARTAQAKLRDVVSVRDFGAVCDGATDDTVALAAAIAAYPNGHIQGYGDCLVTATLNLNGFAGIIDGLKLKAGADGITVLQSTTNMWGAKLIDVHIDGNGHAGVTACDFERFQAQGAAFVRPYITQCENGIIFRSLCWDLKVDCPEIFDVTNPIIVMDGTDSIQINHPRIDTFGAASVGIDILTGTPNAVTAVQVLNGLVQNGGTGIRDAGVGTQIIGTYFERCTEADISLVSGSRNFASYNTSHFAVAGAVAYKGRNADSARIHAPIMGSSQRATGLFDFDGSNTNCYADYNTGATAFNDPIGIVTGLGMLPTEAGGTFAPTVVGTGSAGVGTYTKQVGRWRRIGKRAFLEVVVAWTAHTGTGNTAVTGFPLDLAPTLTPEHQRFPVWLGMAFTGPVTAMYFNTETMLSVIQTDTAGADSLLTLPVSGQIMFSASYDVA